MGISWKLEQELTHKVLGDIKNFQGMRVDEKLRVTDPDAYEGQHERLNTIKQEYTAVVKAKVMEHIDLVVSDVLDDLKNRRSNMITADMIVCG